MKKILFTLVALLMAGMAMAQTPAYVRVNPTEGSPVLFKMSAEPQITMLAEGIQVTATDADPVSFMFDGLASIDFPTSSEVEKVAKSDINVASYPDRVVFSNIPEGEMVRIFSINGTQVFAAEAGGEATVMKADYPKGIYVVRIGSTSFKIIL